MISRCRQHLEIFIIEAIFTSKAPLAVAILHERTIIQIDDAILNQVEYGPEDRKVTINVKKSKKNFGLINKLIYIKIHNTDGGFSIT